MVPPSESISNVMFMLIVVACAIKNSILKKGHLKSLQLIPHLINLLLSLEPLRIKDDQ
jgi:hypothetical protein